MPPMSEVRRRFSEFYNDAVNEHEELLKTEALQVFATNSEVVTAPSEHFHQVGAGMYIENGGTTNFCPKR